MFETRTFDLIVTSDEADLVIYEFDCQTGQDLGFMGLTSFCGGPSPAQPTKVAA